MKAYIDLPKKALTLVRKRQLNNKSLGLYIEKIPKLFA